MSVQGFAPTVTVGRSVLEAVAEMLTDARTAALLSKDFSKVDAIKSALLEAGVEVRMSKAGVELLPGHSFDPAKLEALK